MNSEFQENSSKQRKHLTKLLIYLFLNVILAIFKNSFDFSLSILPLVNGIFFFIFYIYTSHKKYHPNDFPNLFKLNIGVCLYDLVINFLICIKETFNIHKNDDPSAPYRKLYFMACFLTLLIEPFLIHEIFYMHKLKRKEHELHHKLLN